MFKEFLLKKLIKNQLKGVPPAVQDKIIGAIEKDPAFFEKIGKEIEHATKNGKDKTAAAMEVARKYQTELQKLIQQ